MKISKLIIITACVTLQACGNYLYVNKPFKASLPNQVFETRFVVPKEYTYRISLIFNWQNPEDREITQRQEKLIGWSGGEGIELPLDVTIIKDGRLFIDSIARSTRSHSLEGFCYNTEAKVGEPPPSFWRDMFFGEIDCSAKFNRKRIWGPARTIEARLLPPGNYHVIVRTIIPTKEFSDMEIFIGVSAYSPKI